MAILKLSASSMGTYDKCPKQYQYRYLLKPKIEEKDWSFLEFGKCAHRTLELFHEYLMKNVVDPENYKDVMKTSLMEAVKEFKLSVIKKDFPELKEILSSYLDKMVKDGLPNVLHNELDFKMMIGDFMVRGSIDRVDRVGPGHYMISDYKTNKNPAYLKPFQLILYALALKEIYPDAEKIDGRYILLKHNCDDKAYSFKESDYKKVTNKVLSIGTDITVGENWIKKPTALCNYCDYQKICEGSWIE